MDSWMPVHDFTSKDAIDMMEKANFEVEHRIEGYRITGMQKAIDRLKALFNRSVDSVCNSDPFKAHVGKVSREHPEIFSQYAKAVKEKFEQEIRESFDELNRV